MIEAKDMKAGTIFYEYDMGKYLKYQAITDAVEINEEFKNGYSFRAVALEQDAPMANDEGVITYFEAKECYGYGLKLYAENEVITYG